MYSKPEIFLVAGVPQVTPRQVVKLVESGAILIDLRMEALRQWKQFDVPGVVWAPEERVEELIKSHPPTQTFILAETSSSERASSIIRRLQNERYHHVFNLAGGFVEWERDGLPIKEDRKYRLTGSCMCQLKPRHRID